MANDALLRQVADELEIRNVIARLARATPEMAEFSRIAREQGFKAAMAWRDGKTGGAR